MCVAGDEKKTQESLNVITSSAELIIYLDRINIDSLRDLVSLRLGATPGLVNICACVCLEASLPLKKKVESVSF